MKSSVFGIFACVLLLLSSCAANDTADIIVKETPVQWTETKGVDVFYENTDTLGQRDVDILVRFRNDFPYDRFDFVLETLTPDSIFWRDTLSVAYSGNTAAEAVSLTYTDIKTAYRSQSRLSLPGSYCFRFTPAMPSRYTEGIIGVGIEINKN